jgi:hypothetical protein
MLKRVKPLQLVAVSALLGILSGLLWPAGLISRILLGLAIPPFIASIGVYLYKRYGPGKYDLAELRELVVEGQYDDSDLPEVDPDGDLYCPCCQSVYNVKFGICPTCATRQTRKT